MQKSFLSFLNEVGLASLRKLSAKSDIHLCRERASGRLLVAKLWPDALKFCGEREIRALSILGAVDLAPRLGIAFESPYGLCMIRPFISGKTLYDFQASQGSASQVALNLRELIKAIHKQGWVHRDLTPSNVLVTEPGVQLLDWELAEQVSNQVNASYSPRGTPGFSMSEPTKDLLQQDLDAVERIVQFLNSSVSTASENETRSRPWWTDLFSARP